MCEHLQLRISLPMLPLSIVRGTATATCEQRAREFTAFLAAALAHRRLRLTPALLQLLAPDDTSLLPPLEQCVSARCIVLADIMCAQGAAQIVQAYVMPLLICCMSRWTSCAQGRG